MQSLLRQLNQQGVALLHEAKRGIEKENLRVTTQGQLVQTAHPDALGSSLTNPMITTDFAENLVEIVTEPCTTLPALLSQLEQINGYVVSILQQEQLWPLSMPPVILSGANIRISEYGASNSALLKHLYRVGLSYRYGKRMQIIAGIHYNFSAPPALIKMLPVLAPELGQDASSLYMNLTRNFLRYYPILIYLFGASPACDQSLLTGAQPDFLERHDDTLWGHEATSLRMSSLGYHNPEQDQVSISYDDVASYADSLLQATRTPYAEYEEIGVMADGQWRQLNDSLLQIENEYYSPIRPKQIAQRCERPSSALARGGVAYVEVRAVDLDPLHPRGISQTQIHFMDVMLLWCLLNPAPPLSAQDNDRIRHNVQQVAAYGRRPGLKIATESGNNVFASWAAAWLEQLLPIAMQVDAQNPERYEDSIHQQILKCRDANLTPSALVAAEMQAGQHSHQEFGVLVARQQTRWLKQKKVDIAFQQRLIAIAQQSIIDQQQLESQTQKTFETYLNAYLQENCSP